MLRTVLLLVFFLGVGLCTFSCWNDSNRKAIYFSDSPEYYRDSLSERNYFGIIPVEVLNQNLLKYEIDYCSNQEVDSVLRILLRWDQKYRELIVEKRRLESDSNDTISELGAKMKKVDSVNFILISRILKNVGWPSIKFFSDSASQAAFFILLHNEREIIPFQDVIERAFSNEDIINSHYAVLKDRILILKGEDQMYGTHCRKNKDGSVSFNDLQDEVEFNRKAIGLTGLKLNSCELMRFQEVEFKANRE